MYKSKAHLAYHLKEYMNSKISSSPKPKYCTSQVATFSTFNLRWHIFLCGKLLKNETPTKIFLIYSMYTYSSIS